MSEPIKSFRELSVPELQDVANAFGVDFESGSNKNAKLSELAENGVTVDMWNEINVATEEPDEEEEAPGAPAESVAPVEKREEPTKVLIKMTRFNNTYHIRGYQFSRQHPFALVGEDDADYLCRVDGGFQMATPGEAKEFYS